MINIQKHYSITCDKCKETLFHSIDEDSAFAGHLVTEGNNEHIRQVAIEYYNWDCKKGKDLCNNNIL